MSEDDLDEDTSDFDAIDFEGVDYLEDNDNAKEKEAAGGKRAKRLKI